MYTDGTKLPKDGSLFTSMRGVTDFGNLAQWDMYESGYGAFANINGPDFMKQDTGSAAILKAFILILENEFKGLEGIDDMTGETSEITDGISTLNMITKVTEQSGSTVTTNYNEKSGRTLTKTIELFLRGLKDPKTQAKTYNGALSSIYPAEYTKEVFNHLFIVMDNTCLQVEGAYLMLNAQPAKSELSILNYTKGTIEFKELGLEWNVFPVRGPQINKLAQSYLDELNKVVVLNSGKFDWSVSRETSKNGKVQTIKDLTFKADATNVNPAWK